MKLNLVGEKFGRLTVIKEDKNKKYAYWCRCDCGEVKSIYSKSLRAGRSKSCGCLQKDLRKQSAINIKERFKEKYKINKVTGCWEWIAALDGHGYGVINFNNSAHKAYRIAYKIFIGDIPTNMQLDHDCHNKDTTCLGGNSCIHRRCVNPDHLKVVTQRINLLNGKGPAAINARKTSCNRGHELTFDNVYVYPNGKRKCIVCRDDYRRRYYLKKHDNRILKA